MKHSNRLLLIILSILGSALYAVLVAFNAVTGIAAALGYISLLMTIFIYNEYWRRHDR